MKFLPLTRQVQLENSNPERLVTASTGTYFYRVGNDLFYLIVKGERRRIELSKRGFALKYQNKIWFPTIRDHYIVFETAHELWQKTKDDTATDGWTFISYKSLDYDGDYMNENDDVDGGTAFGGGFGTDRDGGSTVDGGSGRNLNGFGA